MDTINKIFGWKILFYLLSSVWLIYAGLIAYHAVIGTFNGVDGGLGFVIGIVQLVGLGLFIGTLFFLHSISKNKKSVNTLIVRVIWVCLTIVLALVIFQNVVGNCDAGQYYNSETDQVEPAKVNPCSDRSG